jgi:serine/threonine-protein kinase
VVHRDLKPANLFLVDEDGKRTLKVLDFGISKVTRGPTDGNATFTEALFGSPLYMSPETFRSAKAADVRSDIWSLGVIFYEMLTGVQPFVAEHAMAVGLSVTREAQIPPSQRRANLPRATDVVVERALKKNPDERYQSVREMLAALEVFLPRGRNDTMTLAQVVAPEGDDDPRTLRKDDAHITKLGMIAPASDARASEPDPTEAPTRVQAETAGETGKNFSRPVSDSTPPPAATLSRQKRLPMAAWLVPLVAVVFGVGGFLIASRGASTSSVPAAPATIETTAPARLESPVAETTPTPSAETSAAPIPSATDLPTEVDEVSVEAEPATTPNGAASPKWAPKRNPKKKQPAFVPKGI